MITSIKSNLGAAVAALCAAALLAGCNPTYNWRDYSSADAPYRVMFPDKPASHTRSINLDGMTVDMTMTAAQAEGVTFAVGSAAAPDAAKAQAAVAAMKTALVRNIGATVKSEKSRAPGVIDLEATGVQNGQPMRLLGHFEARDKRFYQVIVMGRQKAVSDEQAEMFLSSFKLQ
jgi:hypothetical protein